ncbi:MAG TPA: hypothetical protein VI933_03825 [archaeon]|nr:hypothetical protein [archaeon]
MVEKPIMVLVAVVGALILFFAAIGFLPTAQAQLEAPAARGLLQSCCTPFISPIPNLCSQSSTTDDKGRTVSITDYKCGGVPKQYSSTGDIKIKDLYRIANNKQVGASVTEDDVKGKLGCDCPKAE